MAVAGRCRICGQNVWLNDQWGCVNGHPWTEISEWYDPDTGTAVTPYWLAQPQTPAEPAAPAASAAPEQPQVATEPAAPEQPQAPAEPAAPASAVSGTRVALLADILAAFAQYPGYSVRYGTDTDIMIDNKVADASWGTGKKNVEYEAVLKAVEGERVVYFWEMLKESGAGLSFGGFEGETTMTMGAKRFGTKKEVVVGPGGKALDYTWDYAATRRIVEDVAARDGWRVKVVLRKKSAQW
jgi:hypothetical protein